MRRLTCLIIALTLIASFISVALDGRVVGVSAEKAVEIKNKDVAAARTTALTLAAREAVEKGYGTYVKVEQLPNARKILATAAAALKYTILAEQQRGNQYWVKIQANVIVPDEYASLSEETREDLGTSMKNFVQKYPQGEINWGDGFILAFGKGEITSRSGQNAEELAARAAETDAKAHLLEIINDIALNDSNKLGEDKKLSFALEGFVQNAEVVAKSRTGTTVNVTVQAPIKGVKGLAFAVYGYYTPEPPVVAEQVKPEPVVEAQTYSGVVIDARQVSPSPAIFPKIQDTKKREVYGVKHVNKQDLQKRGMASYAVAARDAQISKYFPKATIVPVSYRMQDSSEPGKSRRRQGEKPFMIAATDTVGSLKATLIISEEDAGKIRAIDDTTNVLKECRMVIIVSSEPGKF